MHRICTHLFETTLDTGDSSKHDTSGNTIIESLDQTGHRIIMTLFFSDLTFRIRSRSKAACGRQLLVMLVLTILRAHLRFGLKTEHRVPRPAFSRPVITELSCLMTRSPESQPRYLTSQQRCYVYVEIMKRYRTINARARGFWDENISQCLPRADSFRTLLTGYGQLRTQP
jgi:hypothetical protein